MPHTREQAIQKGITLRPTQHSMKRRAVWNDYYLSGRYGITLHIQPNEDGTTDRSLLLGNIEGTCNTKPALPDGTKNTQWPHIKLNELGALIDHRIHQIGTQKNYEDVSLISYCIMPTHLHLTLEVAKQLPVVMKKGRPLQLTLGHMVGYFKSGCTSLYNRWLQGEFAPYTPGSPEWAAQVDLPYAQRTHSLSAQGCQSTLQSSEGGRERGQERGRERGQEGQQEGLRQGQQIAQQEQKPAIRPLWEPNYNDKILNTTRKLAEWIHYVEMNPYYWRLKDEHPHLFEHRLHLNMRMKDGEMVDFSAYGCMFLLRKGDRINVMCHRLATKSMLTPQEWAHYSQPDVAHRYEEERRLRNLGRWDRNWLYSRDPEVKTPIPYTETMAYRQQKAEMLQLAQANTILVSPTISDGEKDIIYSALQEGCPVIKLSKDPFTGKNHPSEKDRQWCAMGLMLILAPWEIPATDGTSSAIPTDSKYTQFHNLNALATRMCDEIANLRMIKLYEE